MVGRCRMSWYWSNRSSVAASAERTEKNQDNLGWICYVTCGVGEMGNGINFLSENLCMKSQLDDIGVNAKKSAMFGIKGLWCGG